MSELCACGDTMDEHCDESGRLGGCTVEGCPCIYFDALGDMDDEGG